MIPPKLILAFGLSLMLCTQSAFAITADELASYLGVFSWRTVVDLPPESFTVQVYEFSDGVIADHPLIDGTTAWSRTPEQGTVVMIGPQDGKYKVALKFSSGGTLSVASDVPVFRNTLSGDLPKVREGDYVILGQPKEGDTPRGSNDLSTFSKGFLLRVKKA